MELPMLASITLTNHEWGFIKFLQVSFYREVGAEVASISRPFQLQFCVKNTSLRISIFNVGRCFCGISIPGGVLRNKYAMGGAERCVRVVQDFGICIHSQVLCDECCDSLLRVCGKEQDHLPPVLWVDFFWRTGCTAPFTCYVMEQSIIARTQFFESFDVRQCSHSKSYELQHRVGNEMDVGPLGSWKY